MKSYVDAIIFLNTQISQLSFEQADRFLHDIMQDFVKNLPSDWLDNELDDEKPFYQTLAKLLSLQNLDTDKISAQIAGLDTIMDAMGEDYPHSTDAYALALLTMVDYYLQFDDESEDFHGFVMGVTDEYLNMADFEAQANDTDNWLDYPQIAQAFDFLEQSLITVKSTI